MRQLELIPMTALDFRRLAADPEGYAAAAGLDIGSRGPLLALLGADGAEFLERNGIEAPWGSYLAIERGSRILMGTCSFKGPPGAGHEVEIAYFTFPEFEGQGVGTAMAGELVAVASRHPEVRSIIAHTLPAESGSTTILRRCGFVRTREVIDPDDGLVWRWERTPAPGGN
jgi:RimJ/RimL family protein N-acetyltransferase